jgi:hypothetical protein
MESLIDQLVSRIPRALLPVSGSVFYSGRAAFTAPSRLYVLGLNPGGSPVKQAAETIAWHTDRVLNRMPAEWSAYSDESWNGRAPGSVGLQPRVLHMMRGLGLDARRVPSSNVAFVRSARESTLDRFSELAGAAWPFHEYVIRELGVRCVLCFGKSAGTWMATRLGATRELGRIVEKNDRRWSTVALANPEGISVVIATHPSIADWTAPPSDPTPFVRSILAQS